MIKIKYKVGEILTNNHDTNGEQENGIIVGADRLAHPIDWWNWLEHGVSFDRWIQSASLKKGMIQHFPEGTEIVGYDTGGLAEYLYRYLEHIFPIMVIFEEYDFTEEEFISEIERALNEIGF